MAAAVFQTLKTFVPAMVAEKLPVPDRKTPGLHVKTLGAE